MTTPANPPGLREDMQQTLDGIYDRADRLIQWLLLAHMTLAVYMASFYDTWFVTFAVGLSGLGMFSVARRLLPCTFFTRCTAGVALQVFVALHIYQVHGMAEQHFFFFTTWTAMIVYQDWRCMWPGTLLIIGQHILFAVLHNAGAQLYFFEDPYVGVRKLSFHFGIALFQVGLCGYWSVLLRRQTVANVEQHARLREASAAAERATAHKSMFVATVSHEIRTPLSGMLGMVDLLQETAKGPQEREYLDLLRRSGEALVTILGDVLDSEKLAAGRVEFVTETFDLHAALRDVVRLMDKRATDKRIALHLAIADECPRWVAGDSGRLRQILLNLMSNAIKFTASGEVRLKARTDDPFAEPVTVVVEVVDTGIGMDTSELARLFQPFQQANVETTRRYGGTGLGLCISRGLAEGMGGNLTAASEPGRGSTFTLVLPLVRADSPRQREHETAGQSNADAARLRGLRVLVAEDNPINQRLLSAMLERAGCIVIAATDGRAAVERHGDSAPDLILMDCRMPVLDGAEATRAIRAAEQGRRRTPIIALSADSMLFERERCLEAGMDEFCEKPIDGKGLLEVLRRHTAKPG